MPHPSPSELIAQAEDLENLLDHIAWTDILQPAFKAERDRYSSMLVKSVLGNPVLIETPAGPKELSSEQLASRIAAFDWLETLFTKILSRGRRASERLRTITPTEYQASE